MRPQETLMEDLKADFPELVKVPPEQYIERSIVKQLDDTGFIDGLYR